MPINNKIYEIIISDEGLDTYRGSNISANTMGEYLGINEVMTDFEWDEDVNKGVILYGRILDDISVEDALEELKNVEYIEKVEES
ncbi:hypothetical protein K9O30_03800 [Clostridium bowmanii]|uniref:hypothetical protein n=1 Tax=Clostridium bowmanii TaxID=132925 RepID=UPI001C0D26DE|nr:hypothetical protein [Clostridium bowmanii]MBU3188482.1 hypothetical protein [Clostridium bowmanii]MCA1072867.1 hypothetical protein [Clostridium bowmanii]